VLLLHAWLSASLGFNNEEISEKSLLHFHRNGREIIKEEQVMEIMTSTSVNLN
jgi:hypothetical protein